METRKIIHVDMDSFYAAVEMRDNPVLFQKPLVIGRDPKHSNGRGVVATANYVARTYGIHSAMSTAQAAKLCPDAVFLNPDFEKYRQISQEIHAIFHSFTDVIEPVALDEAYLDVTHNKRQLDSPVVLAHQLQQEIYQSLRLTCSVGVAPNKFLAKLASEYNKPMGFTMISQEDIDAFLLPLPIGKFRGVGAKTKEKMEKLGIEDGADLRAQDLNFLTQHFGKQGFFFYNCARGIDDRPVQAQRQRKSLGYERTFDQGLTTLVEVNDFFKRAASKIVAKLEEKKLRAQSLVVKVRNSNFETITKRYSQKDFLENDVEILVARAETLFEEIQASEPYDVRLLGLTATGLEEKQIENITLDLWG
ncbi:DNA polymerase IV [Ligilactobacillus equi]